VLLELTKALSEGKIFWFELFVRELTKGYCLFK